MKRSFLTFLLILSIFGAEVFAKEWNGIIPCVSTRSDVGKILGKDTFRTPGALGGYWYKKSRVYVDYFRNGKDSPDKDVVRHIAIYPNKSILLAKYVKKIPDFPAGFVKTEENPKISHVRYLAHYFNRTESFEIVVQKNDDDVEVITSFGYYGLDSDCSKLASSPASPSPNN